MAPTPTPTIKLFALIPRRPDLTEEQFHKHWAEYHSTLAVKIRRLKRYSQAHRVEHGLAGLPDSRYDGIAECWFTDLDEARGMGADPDYTEIAQKDDPNFVDLDNLTFLMCDLPEVLRGDAPLPKQPPGITAKVFMTRREDLAPAEFRALAQEVARALPDLFEEAWRVTLALTADDTYGDDPPPAYDGVVEILFHDRASFDAAWARSGEAALSTLDRVLDREGSSGFPSEDLRFIWPEDGVSGG